MSFCRVLSADGRGVSPNKRCCHLWHKSVAQSSVAMCQATSEINSLAEKFKLAGSPSPPATHVAFRDFPAA